MEAERFENTRETVRPAQWQGNGRKVHLIGAAGVGMQALAHALGDAGWCVSGSDELTPAAELQERGMLMYAGQNEAHVPQDATWVVHSAAVAADHVERRTAENLGIPVSSYPQALGRLMQGSCGLAVAGTHGKSTTTAMTAEILLAAGLDPTFFIGATPKGNYRAGRGGKSDIVLAEACEYREHFLHLAPQAAAILNIEPDHFDYYHTPAQLTSAFTTFASRLPADGLLVANSDCPTTREVVRPLVSNQQACRVETFGWAKGADWQAENVEQERGCYRFQLMYRRENWGWVRLQVPGRHQVGNALAAAALARFAGAGKKEIGQGLQQFRGLKRRLETVLEVDGLTVVSDYGHHPTEIRAALETLREMFPERRICCIFQPHQHSRTWHLLDEFAASLQNADAVAVLEIFAARESPQDRPTVSAAHLAQRVRQQGGNVWPWQQAENVLNQLPRFLIAGDVLVMMGAGDIGALCHAVCRRFQGNRKAG